MTRNTGFNNEKEIQEAINGNSLNTIKQNHIKEFIKDIFDNQIANDSKILCEIAKAQFVNIKGVEKRINVKQDLIITSENQKKYISIKKGSGNSVHEESIYTFILFLKDLGASSQVIDSLLRFQWADGTLDNTGDKEKRLKGKDVFIKYRKDVEIIHNFFNNNRLPIIKRVLSLGAYEKTDSKVDFIFHGTIHDGVWCSLDTAISINSNPENSLNPISVGFLTYQNQNRNLTLNPNKERARKQIQFKWSNMQPIIEKSMSSQIRLLSPSNITGNNKHGFENINFIIYALNGSKIINLKDNLRAFIKDLFPNADENSIITAKKLNNREKGSLDITVGKNRIRVLVKSGSGNSIHQEKYEEFYKFLKEELGASDEVINSFKIIQWGDGTLDGKSHQSRWLKSSEIKKKFPNEIKICNTFLNQKIVAIALLNRFLIYGTMQDNKPVDYVYFGDTNSAYWAKSKDIIDLQLQNLETRNNALLHIGNFNIQSWGRTIKKSVNIDQRESMQVKAPYLEKDVKLLSKKKKNPSYYERGNKAEITFVQDYNRGHFISNNYKFKDLLIAEDSPYKYAVQVQTNQLSNLTKKKERTKSDAYIISTNKKLNEAVLFEKDYILGEKEIFHLDYQIVQESGVSIKMKDSKNITYAKLSRNAFEQLFRGNLHLFVGALLYVDKEENFRKNEIIIQSNNISLNELITLFNVDMDLEISEIYKQIKNKAINEIKYIIENDLTIKSALIFGSHIFEEPYCATYLYKDKMEHKNEIIGDLPFTVTTGSGRSKGIYTIVIKQ